MFAPARASALLLCLVFAGVLWVSPAGATSTPYGAAVLAVPSVQGYWPLDETTGTTAYDAAASPANGTYSGTVSLGGSGALTTSTDYAPDLGSSSYVSTGWAAKLQPSASASLEVWFKSSGSGGPLIESGDAQQLQLSLSGGQLLGYVDGMMVESADLNLNDGDWHYGVLTWTGSREALYVDGQLAQPGSTGNPVTETSAPSYGTPGVTIGETYVYYDYYYFDGSVDEPALYGSDTDSSGALTPGEVANHYAAGLSGPVETPVNISAPTVTGRPLVGSTYTVSDPGSWSSSSEIYGSLSYSYQWKRCSYTGSSCGAISGATASTYIVGSTDAGHALAVTVTASNTGASNSATVQLPAIGGYRSQVFVDGGSDLRGYWPLDETESYPYEQAAVDASASPADGTYEGAAVGGAGAIGDGSDTAAVFDGSSEVTTAAASKLQPSASASLEVWFKTSGSGGPLIESGAELQLQLSVGDGQLVGYVAGTMVESADLNLDDGDWHYGVLTWDGSREALYVDGHLAQPGLTGNPVSETSAPSYGSTGVAIGEDYVYYDYNYFDGSIDEPALYGSDTGSSGALTPGEIANHYASRTAAVSTPVDVVAPTVSGKPLVGSTYSVSDQGSWSSSSAIYGSLSYSYQWKRCSYTGSSCSAISGATGSGYTVGSADRGHALAITVTASNTSASDSATVQLPAIGGYRSQVFVDGGSNLRGYWPLDEGDTYPLYQAAVDISASPADGTYEGPTVGVAGAIGDGSDSAAVFDGSSEVTTAAASKLQPSASASLEVWFKTAGSGGPLIASGPELQLQLSVGDGQLVGYVAGIPVESADLGLDDGAWHYAVLTWDGNQEALYVDGQLAPPQPGTSNPRVETGAPSYSGEGVTIGESYVYYDYYYFDGSIDEPALYGSDTNSSGALTPGEIANHYASRTAAVSTPVDVVAPTVSGKPLVGSSYAVSDPGSWSSSSEIYGALSYSYQWKRCNYTGTSCSAIIDATSSSYTVTAADEHHALAVTVTASNSSASNTRTVQLPQISGYRSAVLQDGGSNLRGYWPLDDAESFPDGQPAADMSASPADGTYEGVTIGDAGAIGDGSDSAAVFDESSEVTTAAASKLQPSASASLEVWFKSSGLGGPLIESGNSGALQLWLSGGQLIGYVDGISVESADLDLDDGAWHYGVLTWDGSQEALYIDGHLAPPLPAGRPNPTSETSSPSYGSLGVTLGETYSSYDYYFFDGSIDEAALYGSNTNTSGALSAAQVAEHYLLATNLPIPLSAFLGGGSDASPASQGCKCGDPIEVESGDYYETATDAAGAGFGPPLAFTRTYDASLAQSQVKAGSPGDMGYGWTDNWDANLSIDGLGDVTVTQPNGAQVTFYPPSGGACPSPYVGPGTSGTYCALPSVTASLVYDSGSSTYTFITHPYRNYTFNSSGELTKISGVGGASLAVSRNTPVPGTANCPSSASSCDTVTASSGREIVIAKDSSGRIIASVDPLGRTWTYAYCSPPSGSCSAGDLVSVTDPMSRVTSYTYDEDNPNASLQHDLLAVTRPNGQTGGPDAGAQLVNVYNSDGRVTAQTDPDGNETTFDYSNMDVADGLGYVIVTDPDGNETQYSYSSGVLVSRTSGYGTASAATTSYSPDNATLLNDSVTDANGHTTSYGYDANGNVTSITDPMGRTSTFAYNDFDERTCAAGPLAATGCGSLSPPSAMTAGGSTITPPSSAPPKYVTYSLYDTDGDPIWTTTGDYNPGSSTADQSRTNYNLYSGQSVTLGTTTDSCSASAADSSLPCATVDPNGVVTQLGYDATTGDLTSTSAPDGNSGGEAAETTYTYTGDGLVETVTAPDGNLSGASAADFTTTNTYDDDNELTGKSVSRTGGTITARSWIYGYDDDGNQTSVVDPRGKETDSAYDGNDQLTLVTDPDDQSTLTCYDGDGHVAQTVPPVGVAANSLTAASCPTSFPSDYGTRLASDAITYAYDALGDQAVITTPAPAGQSGHETTTNTYDGAGQLTSTDAPPASNSGSASDQVTDYTYDADGELLTVTKGYGTADASTTSYCYDPNGNKTASVAPDGTISAVPTCSSSAPYQTSSGYQTSYSYDSLGELVSETCPATSWATGGQTTTYTYDSAGNVLTSEDPNGVTTTTTYTPLNQPASISYSGSAAHAVSFGYDANGNRTAMTDATGALSYGYDVFDELTSYENGAGKTVGYSYDSDGDTTGITYRLGAGASWASTDTVGYGYDDAGELSSVTDFNGNMITIGNTADGLPDSLTLASTGDTITAGYDPTDTPESITLGNGSTLLRFEYSDAPSGAVSSETDTPSWSGSPADYSYDAQNRVTQMTPGSSGPLSYAFDASGNLTALPDGASGTYDGASELTSSALSGTTTYTYDADGERTQATRSGSTVMSAGYNGAQELTSYSNAAANMTVAVYDGDGLRASTTTTPAGGSATTEDFTWDTTSAVPHLLQDSDNAYIYGPGDTPIEQVNLSTGDVTYLVSDSLGSVRGAVDATGALTASTAYDAWGNPETSGRLTSSTPFGYAGSYTDPTGLAYLVNRYYDPQTGQFITVDPLVDQTQAPYAYAVGDPVVSADPDGLGLWGDINPFSPSNIIRRSSEHNGLLGRVVKYADPEYWAVSAYGAEASAFEEGCSAWAVAGYGSEGIFALGVGAAVPEDGELAAGAEDGGRGLFSRAISRLSDETGSWSPFAGRTTSNFELTVKRLEEFHGISRTVASERLHAIKAAAGLGPADNVLFDRTGNVYDAVTGDYLGSLTEGGG